MDLRKLKKLIDLVEESGIAEIEVTEGEEKVRITRSLAAAPQALYAAPAPLAHAPAPVAATRSARSTKVSGQPGAVITASVRSASTKFIRGGRSGY